MGMVGEMGRCWVSMKYEGVQWETIRLCASASASGEGCGRCWCLGAFYEWRARSLGVEEMGRGTWEDVRKVVMA